LEKVRSKSTDNTEKYFQRRTNLTRKGDYQGDIGGETREPLPSAYWGEKIPPKKGFYHYHLDEISEKLCLSIILFFSRDLKKKGAPRKVEGLSREKAK